MTKPICAALLTLILATSVHAETKVAAKDLKAGMIVDGATVLKTADLWIDWKNWKGREVIIRGNVFGADERGAQMLSTNLSFLLRRMDSETHRWFLTNCYGISQPDCKGLTISGTPEDDKMGAKTLVNVTIIK